MQRQPLLSVIVPVYNTSKYLHRCVDSLLKQTYRNLEIILVNDGSTDDSLGICDMYAEKNENIRAFHKENEGLGFARNSGLDLAHGEWVAFCDSDDYVDENMYSRLMEKTDCDVDAVFCDFVIQKSNGSLKAAQSMIPAGRYTGKKLLLDMLGAPAEAKRDFLFDMSACKGVYAKNVIDSFSIRFVSERKVICEDLIFHIDFLSRARMVSYINATMYYYCENGGSLTHRFIADRLAKEKVLFYSVNHRVKDLYEDASLRWHRMFLGRVRSTIGQYVYAVKGFKGLSEIRKISNDELVQSVIRKYPINKNPLKLRIFNTFLKWRFCVGMYILLMLNR